MFPTERGDFYDADHGHIRFQRSGEKTQVILTLRGEATVRKALAALDIDWEP